MTTPVFHRLIRLALLAVPMRAVAPRVRELALFSLAFVPSLALAHHGQDFLLVESPSVPHPGSAYLIANSRFSLAGLEEQASFAPALLVGLSPRVAFELHAHAEKLAGESWRYEATAPAVHVLLTDPAKHDGFKLGLSAEYEIARERGEPDNLELRLSAENGSDDTRLAGNLIYQRETGSSGEFGLALGLRHRIGAQLALAVEAQAGLERVAGSEVLAGLYWEGSPAWALKLAVGGERTEDDGLSPVAHVGLVWRLLD